MKVFSKEKFMEERKISACDEKWVNQCDGKTPAECFPYCIPDDWCVDVPDAVEETAPGLCPRPDYQIIITCWDNTTHADMFVNGHKVKETMAKRNPADKFNFRIGAQMAFNRLWEKKKKPVKVKKNWLDDALEAAAKDVAERMRENIMAKW